MSIRSSSRGFTLIEFILALILGMLVVAVGLSIGYQHAQDVDGQELEGAILRVKTTADSAYGQSAGYVSSTGTVVTLPELYSYDTRLPIGVTNNAPGTDAPTAAQLGNEWGGVFTVTAQNSTATALRSCATAGPVAPRDLLTITISKIPAGVCSHMIGVIAPQAYDTTVNGALVALAPEPGAGLPGRSGVNYTKSGGLCADAGSTLRFRFLKPLDFSTLRQSPMTTTMTASEATCVQPQYTRVMNALDAREAAQAAL